MRMAEGSDWADAGEQIVGDLREPRLHLLIRPAKLITASGEYLCVLRDVSATGLKVRTFHALPASVAAQLELGNGDRYAIERVWEQGGHAGFRFTAPVPIEYLLNEAGKYRKRPVRLRIARPALIVAGGKAAPAVTVDLSQQGAGVECAAPLARDQQVRIEIDGLPPIVAKVRWQRGQAAGLVFEETFQLAEFARLAFVLQPAGRPVDPDAEDELLTRYG